jgi:hypothetical protein
VTVVVAEITLYKSLCNCEVLFATPASQFTYPSIPLKKIIPLGVYPCKALTIVMMLLNLEEDSNSDAKVDQLDESQYGGRLHFTVPHRSRWTPGRVQVKSFCPGGVLVKSM